MSRSRHTLDGSHARARRRHERVSVPSGMFLYPGLTPINISEGGMLLSSTQARRVGQRLTFDLHFGAKVITAQAVVRWCRESSSVFDSDHHVGIQFDSPTIDLTLAIRDVVSESIAD